MTRNADSPAANRPLAAVTGASSGIGLALAGRLAARGYDLALISRSEDRLRRAARDIEAAHGVSCAVIAADLARHEDRERVVARLAAARARLEVLVNNAGFGTHGPFHESELERELALIEVNCAAPVHLARAVLPWMLERRRGFILNVSSVSSFTPGPLMALYYASKAFLTSFSEALWEECRGTGVAVTVLCPGPVPTGFQETAGFAAARTTGPPPMSADEVARAGIDALFHGRRTVIPGMINRVAATLARFAPRRWVLRSVRAIQEARRQARSGQTPDG